MRFTNEMSLILLARLLTAVYVISSLAVGQLSVEDWKTRVRQASSQRDWDNAMRIVDAELVAAPNDPEILSWRAKVLFWSGHWKEAEGLYSEIIQLAPNDPDYYLGFAAVYLAEGCANQAQKTLSTALVLDPARADLHVAMGRALRDMQNLKEAKAEFQKALALEPSNKEAQLGLASLQVEPRHEIRFSTNTDWFSFTSPNYDQGVVLTSQWTPYLRTMEAASSYQWAGTNADKAAISVTGMAPRWGALGVGAAWAHDNGVVPRAETFFDIDHGLRFGNSIVRAVELDYGQHWYWYSSARILAINQMALFYFPHDLTWGIDLIAARSTFSGSGPDWRPSEVARLGFPIVGGEVPHLEGNFFFAVGTEDFALVNQIGHFSSETPGAGLRWHLTRSQELTAVVSYQMRTQGHTETSSGFTYAFRF